jgi:hypothetical protein
MATSSARQEPRPEDLSIKKGADERTRTADLISLRVICQVLLGLLELANAVFLSDFSALGCCMLHRIALAVVSEWCQKYSDVHLRPRTPFARPLGDNLSTDLMPAPPFVSQCRLARGPRVSLSWSTGRAA